MLSAAHSWLLVLGATDVLFHLSSSMWPLSWGVTTVSAVNMIQPWPFLQTAEKSVWRSVSVRYWREYIQPLLWNLSHHNRLFHLNSCYKHDQVLCVNGETHYWIMSKPCDVISCCSLIWYFEMQGDQIYFNLELYGPPCITHFRSETNQCAFHHFFLFFLLIYCKEWKTQTQ